MATMKTVFLIFIAWLMLGLPLKAEDATDYQFQIQKVDMPTKEVAFYFFRYNGKTGTVEALKYEKPGSKQIGWSPVNEMNKGGAYAYILAVPE